MVAKLGLSSFAWSARGLSSVRSLPPSSSSGLVGRVQLVMSRHDILLAGSKERLVGLVLNSTLDELDLRLNNRVLAADSGRAIVSLALYDWLPLAADFGRPLWVVLGKEFGCLLPWLPGGFAPTVDLQLLKIRFLASSDLIVSRSKQVSCIILNLKAERPTTFLGLG